jgi:hypothetical protein
MQTEEEALVLTQRLTKLQEAVVEAARTFSRRSTEFHEKLADITERFRTLATTNPPSIGKQSKALINETAAFIRTQNQGEASGRIAMGQNFAALEETYKKFFAALSDWQWVDAQLLERQRPRIAELRAILQELLSKNEDLIREVRTWKRFTTEYNRAKRLRIEELKQFGAEISIWLESLDRSEATLGQALEYVTD